MFDFGPGVEPYCHAPNELARRVLVPIFGLLQPSFKTGTPGQIRTDTLLLLREPTLPIGLQGHMVSRYES